MATANHDQPGTTLIVQAARLILPAQARPEDHPKFCKNILVLAMIATAQSYQHSFAVAACVCLVFTATWKDSRLNNFSRARKCGLLHSWIWFLDLKGKQSRSALVGLQWSAKRQFGKSIYIYNHIIWIWCGGSLHQKNLNRSQSRCAAVLSDGFPRLFLCSSPVGSDTPSLRRQENPAVACKWIVFWWYLILSCFLHQSHGWLWTSPWWCLTWETNYQYCSPEL